MFIYTVEVHKHMQTHHAGGAQGFDKFWRQIARI